MEEGIANLEAGLGALRNKNSKMNQNAPSGGRQVRDRRVAVKKKAKETVMFKNSVGRWVGLALVIALAAWGVSHILPGVQLAAQNEKPGPPAADATVKSFGAKGDGVSDDDAAIQKAVDSKAGTIRFPPGTYKLSKTIEVDLDKVGWTAFVGEGTARLVMTGPGPAIRFVGTHEGTADPKSFKDSVWEKQRMPRVSGLEIVGGHPEADGIEASGMDADEQFVSPG